MRVDHLSSVAAAAGLVAQEAVEAKGGSHDLLVTHRNINLAVVALGVFLAAVRRRREKPGLGYLAAGAAGIAAMNYTAYLGAARGRERRQRRAKPH